MLERRKFLRSGGLLGFLAMGATAAPLVVEKIKEVPVPVPAPVVTADPNVIAILEEQAPPVLQLQATYGEIAPPPPTTSMYVFRGTGNNFVPGTEKQQSVKMVPGPDGELYLNINGQWKKVLTA